MKDKLIENGIEYVRNGDYYIPNFTVSDEKAYNIGKYGYLRKSFLKEHHQAYYTTLVVKGKLLEHLAEIDETCHRFLDDMIPKMAKQEGVTEQLKATDQMEWVRRMNSIKSRAEEFIMKEYVYGGLKNEENICIFNRNINNGKCIFSKCCSRSERIRTL